MPFSCSPQGIQNLTSTVVCKSCWPCVPCTQHMVISTTSLKARDAFSSHLEKPHFVSKTHNSTCTEGCRPSSTYPLNSHPCIHIMCAKPNAPSANLFPFTWGTVMQRHHTDTFPIKNYHLLIHYFCQIYKVQEIFHPKTQNYYFVTKRPSFCQMRSHIFGICHKMPLEKTCTKPPFFHTSVACTAH